MRLTLSVDAAVVARARKSAAALGLSLNQVVRNYLSDLTGRSPREVVVAEVARLSDQAQGDRAGWKFDREQKYSYWTLRQSWRAAGKAPQPYYFELSGFSASDTEEAAVPCGYQSL